MAKVMTMPLLLSLYKVIVFAHRPSLAAKNARISTPSQYSMQSLIKAEAYKKSKAYSSKARLFLTSTAPL